jgi:hypothetical protein
MSRSKLQLCGRRSCRQGHLDASDACWTPAERPELNATLSVGPHHPPSTIHHPSSIQASFPTFQPSSLKSTVHTPEFHAMASNLIHCLGPVFRHKTPSHNGRNPPSLEFSQILNSSASTTRGDALASMSPPTPRSSTLRPSNPRPDDPCLEANR